jgi:rubrerythrin
MPRRLFNKYDAALEVPEFNTVVDDAMAEIVCYAKKHDIDLHDALGVTVMSATAQFGEEFLRNGMKLRKQERAEHIKHLAEQDRSYIKIAHPEFAKRLAFSELSDREKWETWKEQAGSWACPHCGTILEDGPARAQPSHGSSWNCSECDGELTRRTGGGQCDPFGWVLVPIGAN